MKNYYKIMLGRRSMYAEECYTGNFIGADYGVHIDLTNQLAEDSREFKHKYTAEYLKSNPGKDKVAEELACSATWTLCKGMNVGDIILAPNGKFVFYVGEVIGDYTYIPGNILPHRRAVQWLPVTIPRGDVSEELRISTKAQGNGALLITQHAHEIERFIVGMDPGDSPIVNLTEFALEKHLEDFLVKNWQYTELGKNYDIYEVDGELVGQQFITATGPIDILAISKDKKVLLVVELKKGKASDVVVGQIQRYMGYLQAELAENGQLVKGVIIALEDDLKIKWALSVTKNIEFYRYQVSFKLYKN